MQQSLFLPVDTMTTTASFFKRANYGFFPKVLHPALLIQPKGFLHELFTVCFITN